jgi:hypothetical protein
LPVFFQEPVSNRHQHHLTHKQYKKWIPSLITADAQTRLMPAGSLADQLPAQIDATNAKIVRPGGTNYLVPPPRATSWRNRAI